MVRLSYISLLATASIAAAASALVDLVPTNFDTLITSAGAKPALVKFYAPWCGHCKSLAPIYEDLAQKFEKSEGVTIAKADCDAHRAIAVKNEIKGFPTLKFFNSVVEKNAKGPVVYSGPRDIKSLTEFVELHSGVKAESGSGSDPASSVTMLDDSSFHRVVGHDKNVLVAFTASWCGHCRTMAPAYELLAKAFANEPSTVIAKVDAESASSKQIAKEYGISGYPTINFYPKGSSEAVGYSGGRKFEELLSKVNELAGTFRTEAGKLSDEAGINSKAIEAISSAKGNLQEIIKDWETAGTAIEAKAAAFYKTVQRNLNRKGYFDEEIRRLQGLLPKPLSPENHDYIKVRLNILERVSAAVAKAKDAVGVNDENKEEVKEEVKEEAKDEL